MALQHMPPVQVRPGLHLFIGWHMHPRFPAAHSVVSTMPEAPAGIWHIPDLQTPLAQSGPVMHVVFGSGTVGKQYPPVHLPLWQSLACAQCEPAGEPEGALPPEPPAPIEPPAPVEPPALLKPPAPIKPPSDIEPPAPEVDP
jgi:hypothetical protein